ncbi:MAG: response regulator transcription factor [Oscillospiraceae bacterium]|nr:response regulator transcription factor [Oscillospiraceae bacterium]
MAIRIAIVEDDRAASDTVKSYIERYGRENSLQFKITQYPDAVSLLDRYSAEHDIIFMDIQMPYMNGMDAAHRLRSLDGRVILIFTTSLMQYAVEGYEVDALAYLVKPVNYYEFAMKLTKAVKRVPFISKADVVINTKSGDIRLAQEDIRFVEITGHWAVYHTLGGDYTRYSSLTKVESELSKDDFCRCNSCYLVNLACVSRINGLDCILDNGVELRISQPKKKSFLAAIEAYRARHTK